ncbi:MFS transporter [Stygiolobus azoricus]|uniref:MFS transporter n=1 Tax=Stygiolobus azoricus TaxID=41675 RepID=A0A650CPJ2_9CREN|nr:MFS transporter [Stygiolobus azoricus]QGR19764.1 MFS transporter [Stygiolobus azoricus]
MSSSIWNTLWKKRVTHIILFVLVLYLINFLDRVNISYAIDAGMFKDLGLSSAAATVAASLASSLFFIGYFIPQIFSNLLISRIGVRKVFALAFLSWGIITVLIGLSTSVTEVYILRFLLGIAEAPFYAGVIFYLSLWFTRKERATANSLFNAAIPISGIIGGLIAGAIFSVYGNYPGWRYLFFYEGGLAIVAVIFILALMTDFPKDAKWLTTEEKNLLLSEIETSPNVHTKWTRALADPDVIKLAIVYFLGVTSLYGYTIWLPSIISSFSGLSAALSSFLSAIPYLIASISLIFIARYADKKQTHKWVTFYVFLIAGIGLAASAAALRISAVLSFVFFVIAAIGIYSFLSPFWAIPTKFLKGESAAASIGLINAVGNLGGIAGPIIVGVLKAYTNSFLPGIYTMAAFAFVAGIVVLLIKKDVRTMT